jgi:hypothetical protein
MKRFLKCKKGNVLVIVPIYFIAISLVITLIYKIMTINSTKTYIYPYRFNSTDFFEENEYDLANNYIRKIDKTNITSTEDLKNYLKDNGMVEILGASKIYYDSSQDCIYIERSIKEGKIKSRLNYRFENGKIIISLNKYYEGA